MAELKPIEVVMRIDFASSNGIEVIAHAERVCELVRCKDCIYWEQDVIFEDGWCRGKHQGDPYWFCADGERKETEDG